MICECGGDGDDDDQCCVRRDGIVGCGREGMGRHRLRPRESACVRLCVPRGAGTEGSCAGDSWKRRPASLLERDAY